MLSKTGYEDLEDMPQVVEIFQFSLELLFIKVDILGLHTY